MPRCTLRLKLTALLLTAALAVPCAAAAAPTARLQPAGPGLLHQLWTALTAFWSTGITPDDGCKWDPNGGCLPGSAVPAPAITRDDGCKMDPDGRCLLGSALPAPAVTRDDGCKMDP
ncbi:MAG TPA: hypothetical protein VGK45_17085, partial [Thermoanaerobaculia bacterium]